MKNTPVLSVFSMAFIFLVLPLSSGAMPGEWVMLGKNTVKTPLSYWICHCIEIRYHGIDEDVADMAVIHVFEGLGTMKPTLPDEVFIAVGEYFDICENKRVFIRGFDDSELSIEVIELPVERR